MTHEMIKLSEICEYRELDYNITREIYDYYDISEDIRRDLTIALYSTISSSSDRAREFYEALTNYLEDVYGEP